MSKRDSVDEGNSAVNIVGAKPAGLTKKVASDLEGQIKDAFQQSGKDVRVTAVRFIPSTKVDVEPGTFEVMANTYVEASGTGGVLSAQSFDSVVTVVRDGDKGQSLGGVKIPALIRMDS